MKLVVGLGNPQKEYEFTRHNIGFMVLDSFVSGYTEEKKFSALIKKEKISGVDVLFVKPLTFMNLSGNAVSKIARYYQIDVDDLVNSNMPKEEIETLKEQGWSFSNDEKSLILFLKNN